MRERYGSGSRNPSPIDTGSQAKVRSTTQRLGRTSKPWAVSERLTISRQPRRYPGQFGAEFRPLVTAVSEAFSETDTARTGSPEAVSRHRAPERRPDEPTACSSNPSVSTRICRFLPLIFLPAS